MSAAMAVAPMRKSWNRKVTQARMPIEPSTMSNRACWASSALMIGPMFASCRTSSIGPNLSSSAKRRSASLPVVGRPMAPPAPGDADGAGLAPGTTAPDAPGEAEGPALASADALGAADEAELAAADEPGDAGGTDVPGGSVLIAAGEAVAAEPDAAVDPDGDGAPEAPGLGLGLGLVFGNSASPICSVRISTYDLSPAVVIAAVPGRSCAAMISWTCAVEGAPLAKWISQTVPPVKSIENWSPTFPPVRGVRTMKISPGIVMM